MTWTLLVYRIGYVGDHMGKRNSGIAHTVRPQESIKSWASTIQRKLVSSLLKRYATRFRNGIDYM